MGVVDLLVSLLPLLLLPLLLSPFLRYPLTRWYQNSQLLNHGARITAPINLRSIAYFSRPPLYATGDIHFERNLAWRPI